MRVIVNNLEKNSVKSRKDVLKPYRIGFGITIFIISLKVAITMIAFANSSLSLNPDTRFVFPETDFSLSFYIRAFLYTFLSAAPKVLMLSITFAMAYVTNLYIMRMKLKDPLINSQYLNSFIYFAKEFFMLGLCILPVAILLSFFFQSIISFS